MIAPTFESTRPARLLQQWSEAPDRFFFADLEFDCRAQVLKRFGVEVPLPKRVMATLETLLERSGELVERRELEDRVWPDTFVSTASLTEAISTLRKALSDNPRCPRFVQTVHRRGYRFVAPVSLDAPGSGSLDVRGSGVPDALASDSLSAPASDSLSAPASDSLSAPPEPERLGAKIIAALTALVALARRVGLGFARR